MNRPVGCGPCFGAELTDGKCPLQSSRFMHDAFKSELLATSDLPLRERFRLHSVNLACSAVTPGKNMRSSWGRKNEAARDTLPSFAVWIAIEKALL